MAAISTFITALKAEHIKKKGTGIYVLGFILAALTPLIAIAVLVAKPALNMENTFPVNAFEDFLSNFTTAFTSFFYPLAIIICVSRVSQLDHRYGGWQLMETQPLTKFSIFFSKFSIVLIHNLIAIFTFLALSMAVCALVPVFADVPKGMEYSIPFFFLFQIATRLFIAGLFLSALQYLIAVILPSFIWSIVIGFFGLLISSFLGGFNIETVFNPFTVIGRVGDFPKASQLGHFLLFSEWLGLGLALFLLLVGFRWYDLKNFFTAFFRKKRFVTTIAVLALFSAGLYLFTKPNEFAAYGKTVVAGKVASDRTFSYVSVVDPFTTDTLASGKITDGNFRLEIIREVPLAKYELRLRSDMDAGTEFFMASKDSLFFDVRNFGNNQKVEVTGTRLAENQPWKATAFDWSMAEFMIEGNGYLDKPDVVAKQIHEEWEDAVADAKGNKTRDNVISRKDFLDLDKKRIHLRFLNMWDDFMDKRKVVFPDAASVKEPAGISEMRKHLSMEDQTLASDESYFKYLIHQLTIKDTSDVDRNTKELNAISGLRKSSFKDRMLFAKLKSALEQASGSQQRKVFMENYAVGIADSNLKKLISGIYVAQERIAKGNPAPDFEAMDLEGKPVRLSDFKGKYVVIDVWATWCGPCRFQSPFFEETALKLKKNNVVFVALSVDKDKPAWFLEAKKKSKSVKQLHIGTAGLFATEYSLEGIPRFIFIDPAGNFVNSKMVAPSENAFGELIEKELKVVGN